MFSDSLSLYLLGPAVDLAREIIAWLAEVGKADCCVVGVVQARECLQLALINRAALFGRGVRQEAVPKNAAVDHLHDVEHGAEDAIVGTQRIGPRHRETGRIKRCDDTILAVDGVRGGQQFAARLFAQHVLL